MNSLQRNWDDWPLNTRTKPARCERRDEREESGAQLRRLGVVQARTSLLAFTRWTYPRYVADPAHALIAAQLEEVLRGNITRLMVFAPPQHGKSELVSIRFPAWWLGRRPEDPVILASYAASLAERHSAEARAVVQSAAFAEELFPGLSPRQDSRSKRLWRLAGHRGGMLAVGVGGPITGHGAALGIIDDPFENWEQAQSATVRDRVWDWWRGTFRTRIWEEGSIILVMTRWHEDDLAGRLLSDQGDRWRVLRFPALAEDQAERDEGARLLGLPAGEPDFLGRAPGEALCPQRFSVEALAEIRRDVGSQVWSAEYQGLPRPLEGALFRRAWFGVVSAAPAVTALSTTARVRYWDKAASAAGGDYTVGVLLGVCEGRYFVLDVVRGQWSSHEREQVIRRTAEQDGAGVEIWLEQEPGSAGKDSAAATLRALVGFNAHAAPVTGDKVTRALPFAAQAEAGNVALLRAAWNAAYLDELCAFPSGAHDDQVDASSGAFNRLARRQGQARSFQG